MTKNSERTIRVGITLGDANGIGPEIVIKALQDQRMMDRMTPIIYGSQEVITENEERIDSGPLDIEKIKKADRAKSGKVNLIEACGPIQLSFGNPTKESAEYAIKSLDAATKDMAANKIDVLVTAPIHKEEMQNAGFDFPGHTEYLADMSNIDEALMMMVDENLRVALVTTHLPLKEVPSQLTESMIKGKLDQLISSLQKDFGIDKPKIAVLGLNPHAGEKGKMGHEESEIITPVIQEYGKEALVFGPYPADGFFGSENRRNFDAVLAMYHDQGLAPFKALAFRDGVNFTAGLPIVRTSPDHGTAFEIAGKNRADPTSFRAALQLATDVFRQRNLEKEINAQPLKKQKMPKNDSTNF